MDARVASGQGRHRSGRIDESSRRRRREIGSRPGSPILFIVNPASGAGKAGREWAGIESWLPSSGLPYEVASEEEMISFLGARGFVHERSRIKPEGGVSVYLFRR